MIRGSGRLVVLGGNEGKGASRRASKPRRHAPSAVGRLPLWRWVCCGELQGVGDLFE